VAVEYVAGQAVSGFAAVEQVADGAAVLGVAAVLQYVQRFDDAAEFGQGDLSVRVLLDVPPGDVVPPLAMIVAKRDHAHRRRCACHVQLQQLRTVGLAHVQQPVDGVVQPA